MLFLLLAHLLLRSFIPVAAVVEEEAVPVEEVSKPKRAARRKRSAAGCHVAGVGKEVSVEEAPNPKRAARGKQGAAIRFHRLLTISIQLLLNAHR